MFYLFTILSMLLLQYIIVLQNTQKEKRICRNQNKLSVHTVWAKNKRKREREHTNKAGVGSSRKWNVIIKALNPYCQAQVPIPIPKSWLSPTNSKRTGADTKILWATHHHPPHPITFEHDGRVPHKKSKSKKGSEWSPLLVQQKKTQVDSKRKDME